MNDLLDRLYCQVIDDIKKSVLGICCSTIVLNGTKKKMKIYVFSGAFSTCISEYIFRLENEPHFTLHILKPNAWFCIFFPIFLSNFVQKKNILGQFSAYYVTIFFLSKNSASKKFFKINIITLVQCCK